MHCHMPNLFVPSNFFTSNFAFVTVDIVIYKVFDDTKEFNIVINGDENFKMNLMTSISIKRLCKPF